MGSEKESLDLTDRNTSLPAATAALSAEDHADLVNALKDKLQSLAGQHVDVLETLSPNVRKRVKFLRGMQGLIGAVTQMELISSFFGYPSCPLDESLHLSPTR